MESPLASSVYGAQQEVANDYYTVDPLEKLPPSAARTQDTPPDKQQHAEDSQIVAGPLHSMATVPLHTSQNQDDPMSLFAHNVLGTGVELDDMPFIGIQDLLDFTGDTGQFFGI